MEKIHTNHDSKEKRRLLRNNMTQEERILWSQIKEDKLGVRFCRQHSFGHYIVDFYCASKKLIIELDGKHHLLQKEYDDERTSVFKSFGFTVMRFQNSEIRTNLVGVLKTIENFIYR